MPKLEEWVVEPINSGETYQITTAGSTGFVVLAETPIDPPPDAAAVARLMAKAPVLLAMTRVLLRNAPDSIITQLLSNQLRDLEDWKE